MPEDVKSGISKKYTGEANPFYGKHHTVEALAKIATYHLGKPLSEEHKAKISEANKGKVRTEEQRANLSKAKSGTHHTEETKLKLSQITKAQRVRTMGESNSIDRTGTHHSEETRAKMRIHHKGMTGLHPSAEHRAKISKANTGKHPTEETRVKLVKSHQGKFLGEENHQWLGGKSFEPYTQEFNKELKQLIRIRDAYTCQLCGIPERENLRKLPIHHIDYDKSNSMPTNLITLCTICNAKVNKNREYWTGYFRELLNKRQLNSKALVKKRQSSEKDTILVK